MNTIRRVSAFTALAACFCCPVFGQQQKLPSAPVPEQRLQLLAQTADPQMSAPQARVAQTPATMANQPAAQGQTLTLQQAQQIALQNHPQVLGAVALAAAAQAQVTQAKSAYYPTVFGSATGVDAENNSRIAAGALNNPVIYERYANGLTVDQLVTDFGRTHELVKSSDLHAKAQQENVVTTRADVLLGVDQAYYSLLRAQAVLTVAQQTVKERQIVSDQITTLERNQLRSGLDVTFANVNLAQAKLLLITAQNDVDAAQADLSAALGYSDQRTFALQDEPMPAAPPTDVANLLQQAFMNRPELIGLRLDAASAHAYATAERDLWFPTLSAAGSAGLTPYGATQLAPRYAAAGFNLNIPIFNGHLFGALRTEANQNAIAVDQNLRNEMDLIARDVRTAWLDANSAYQRLSVTDQLLDEANQSLNLAQSRYNLGLSSIIELSQAQLNQTQAQIEQSSAKYDYQTQISVLNFQTGALH
ncbi:MAG TPA: TolC family protein [Candidatus Aquilonibacter sp.]|nr:TolC family protein [Candidatus Aquilonibacter sp.]